jgi:hypothetical protein
MLCLDRSNKHDNSRRPKPAVVSRTRPPMRSLYAAILFSFAALAGCGGAPEPLPLEMQQASLPAPAAQTPPAQTPPVQSAPAQSPVAQAPTAPAQQVAPPMVQPVVAPSTSPLPPPAGIVANPRQSEEDEQWATEADMKGIREKAAAGMGRQGRTYGNDPFTYPLAQYFHIRQRMGLEQINHAMDLYKATYERYPRTQDEFRKEIIKANAIDLPLLPEGHKFYYDPQKGELMVIRPQQQ